MCLFRSGNDARLLLLLLVPSIQLLLLKKRKKKENVLVLVSISMFVYQSVLGDDFLSTFLLGVGGGVGA